MILRSILNYFLPLILLLSSCDKELYVSPPNAPLPSNNMLFVNTIPNGVSIFLDDKNTGFITPDTLQFVEEGIHKITFKKLNYRSVDQNIIIKDGENTSINYNYFDDPQTYGELNCNSIPQNAEIIINDSLTGLKTPALIKNLLPGSYKVKYSLFDHRSDSNNVFVSSSNVEKVELTLMDTSVWVNYNKKTSSIPDDYVYDIIIDNNNAKWFATGEKGVVKYNNGIWETFNKENSGLIHNITTVIKKDDNGRIWIGTSGGLSIYNKSNWSNFNTTNSGLPSDAISDINFTSDGVAWIGTQNGLVRFDGTNWQVYNISNSDIPANFVTTITIDNDDNVIIGTNTFGIAKYDGTNWKTYNVINEGLPSNGIVSSSKAPNGDIWFVHSENKDISYLGGITVYNGQSFQQSTFGIISNNIKDIYFDMNENIWISTNEGISKITGGKVINYNKAQNNMPTNKITSLIQEDNDLIWISTLGDGVIKFKEYKITN